MKSPAARAEIGSHDEAHVLAESAPQEARHVRVEDLGDGSAQISLRLPWPMVLQVLDLASAGATARTSALA